MSAISKSGNRGYDILELFDILTNFSFVISETECHC